MALRFRRHWTRVWLTNCVVEYDGLPYPGEIVDVDEASLEVNAMHSVGNNRFFWPLVPDVIWFDSTNLGTLIPGEPDHVTSRHRALPKQVWELIIKKLNLS